MGILGPMVSNKYHRSKTPPKRTIIHSSFVMYQAAVVPRYQSLEGSKPRLCTTTLLLCPPLQERK